MAYTAPSPANTAPKASAARMAQLNMQLTLRVSRSTSTMIFQVSRLLIRAMMVMAMAPTAELSTRLVTPMKNSPDMRKMMRMGRMAELSSLNFWPQGMLRSSFEAAGPSWGWMKQRIMIYRMNMTASMQPGRT